MVRRFAEPREAVDLPVRASVLFVVRWELLLSAGSAARESIAGSIAWAVASCIVSWEGIPAFLSHEGTCTVLSTSRSWARAATEINGGPTVKCRHSGLNIHAGRRQLTL